MIMIFPICAYICKVQSFMICSIALNLGLTLGDTISPIMTIPTEKCMEWTSALSESHSKPHFTHIYHDFSSNIPVSQTDGAYISHLIRYSRACAQYSNFLDRTQLLTQNLLKQGYVPPKLPSSLQKIYGRHHDLVDRYELSISRIIFLSSVSATTLVGLYIWVKRPVSYKK